MPDSKGKKLADALYGQPEEKAAFGVFPQMKPRRSKQDPEAAKDVPRQLLRGWAAGTLGLPGDIEGLIRMLPGLDETPRLPTSEFYLDYLPGKAEGESGKTAAAAGTLFGGLGSTKAARGALEAGKGAAKLAERAAAMPSPSGLAAQRGVVKLPGGNWLTGSVEKAVDPLRPSIAGDLDKYVRRLEAMRKNTDLSEEQIANIDRNLLAARKDLAVDNWVKSNLTNYVKKQMATPEDPVRKLAEEGVLHYRPPEESRVIQANAQLHRNLTGGKNMGESLLARQWEDVADAAINPFEAGSAQIWGGKETLEKNPWLQKLDPKEKVYQATLRNMGFDHIIDVLRQDLAAGRIRPEQLNKVSMEQAVRRTYEYDQEMAKKMAEAQIKATEGMPVYKEYPEGYKWVELTAGEKVKPQIVQTETGGWAVLDNTGHSVSSFKSKEGAEKALAQLSKNDPRFTEGYSKEGQEALENALKYEGETMGHCVGGYCPDVLEGRSRIFSLRDAKGEPHVTIEVQPAAEHRGFGRGGQRPPEEDYYRLQEEWLEGNRNGTIDPNLTFAEWWRSTQGLPEDKRPPQIVQIKGKQNAAPKEEYLPYVQDFVKGGQWSRVGDFRNTGLIDISDRARAIGEITGNPNAAFTPPELIEAFKRIPEGTRYMTREEFEQLMKPPAEGMKRGGKVHISDNLDTMRLELAGGGAPKAIAQRLKTLREQLAERAAATEAIQARDRKLPLEQIPEGSLTPEAIEAEIKRMREEKGMAAGGNVDRLTPRQMLYLSSSEDIAKLTPHQQREVVANMGGDELRQRMSGYFAKGGAVKKTKVSDNPDTMRLELMKAKG